MFNLPLDVAYEAQIKQCFSLGPISLKNVYLSYDF